MVIGHYAVAMAAKRVAPRTSLGTLIAAAIFLDLLWPLLALFGLEIVAVTPGATVVTPLTFVSYPYSHSLLMSVVWGLLFAGGYYVARRYVAGTIAVGVLVVSHWVLDAVVHVPDLPLTPWGSTRIGLGLWDSLTLTLSVELVLFALGVLLYLGGTTRRDSTGTWGLGLMIGALLLIYVFAIFGPPPPNPTVVALSAMGQWLVVALAAWADRHRRAS